MWRAGLPDVRALLSVSKRLIRKGKIIVINKHSRESTD